MPLSYRGTHYQSTAIAQPSGETHFSGCYRGVNITIKTTPSIIRPETAIGLKYRGASYLKLD